MTEDAGQEKTAQRRSAKVSSLKTALGLLLLTTLPLLIGHLLLDVSFLNPWGLLTFLLAFIVILFYLLKRQRKPRPVSTLFFWTEVQKDLDASAPFQKLRRQLLLALQLFILALLTYALGKPVLAFQRRDATSTLLIIDVSSSMQTMESDRRTRLEVARSLAVDRINAMNSGDRMMIVTVGSAARALQPWTEYKEVLLRSVRKITIEEGKTRLDEALLLAAATLRSRAATENLELVVLSDGATEDLQGNLDLPEKVVFQKIGESNDNLAITQLNVQTSDEEAPKHSLFTTVENFSSRERTVTLSARRFEKLLGARKVTLGPGESRSTLFRLGSVESGPIRVELSALNEKAKLDDLALDNRAFAVIPPAAKSEVLVLSKDPELFERAIAADERIVMKVIPSYDAEKAAGARLIIFDQVPIPEVLPPVPCLFIMPPNLEGRLSWGDSFGPGIVNSWNRDYERMIYVDPSTLAIRRARQIVLGETGLSLMEVDGKAVSAAFYDRDIEHIVLGFALRESNWPLHLSFPIFLRNVVTSALNQGRDGHPYQVEVGEPLPIRLPRSDLGVEVTNPKGDIVKVVARDGLAFFPGTKESGVYKVSQADGDSFFAVNLFDRRESNIAPKLRLKVGRRLHEAREESVQKQIFRPILALALLVLLVEFAVWKYRL
ncbi:MAG: VWA domain-containing protein [Planctomycetota bacterium]|nr:VWA domain-containing protein [Planctomycetota bacterium]